MVQTNNQSLDQEFQSPAKKSFWVISANVLMLIIFGWARVSQAVVGSTGLNGIGTSLADGMANLASATFSGASV